MRDPIRYLSRYMGGLLLLALLSGGCSGGVEEKTVEEAGLTLSLTNPDSGEPVATVSKEAPGLLTAAAADLNGTPVTRATIHFSIDAAGAISPASGTALTDENGQAWVRLTAGATEGVGTATARYGDAAASVQFYSEGDDPNYQLSLELLDAETGESVVILTESVRAQLVATLVDLDEETEATEGEGEEGAASTAGAPVSGAEVTFSAKLGQIVPDPSIVETDADGEAVVFLSPGSIPGAGEATVQYGSFSDNVSYYIDVAEEALNLSVTLLDPETGAPTDRLSDAAPATVTAALADEAGDPVSGKAINFSATAGRILPEDGTAKTDSNGQASVFLAAGDEPVAGEVTATFEEISDRLSYYVDVAEESRILSLVLLDAATGEETTVIPADAPANVVATLTDENGLAVSGEDVRVTASLGELLPADGMATTGSDGTASVFLLAGSGSGAGVVTAEFGEASDRVSYYIEPEVAAANVLTLQLLDPATGEPLSLINTDTPVKAMATLADAEGAPVAGAIVSFSATLGSLQPGSGQSVTGSEGTAAAFLLPGTTRGAGVLSASTDGASDQTTYYVDTRTDPQTGDEIDTVTAERPVQIAASLTDARGNPVSGATVRFQTALGTLAPGDDPADTGARAVTGGEGAAGLFLEVAADAAGIGVVTANTRTKARGCGSKWTDRIGEDG
jgi:hypothetical protein